MNLEDVKYWAVISNQGVHPNVSMSKKEFDWLIEQAEKVERYEKTLTEIVTKLGWREVECEEIIKNSLND